MLLSEASVDRGLSIMDKGPGYNVEFNPLNTQIGSLGSGKRSENKQCGRQTKMDSICITYIVRLFARQTEFLEWRKMNLPSNFMAQWLDGNAVAKRRDASRLLVFGSRIMHRLSSRRQGWKAKTSWILHYQDVMGPLAITITGSYKTIIFPITPIIPSCRQEPLPACGRTRARISSVKDRPASILRK